MLEQEALVGYTLDIIDWWDAIVYAFLEKLEQDDPSELLQAVGWLSGMDELRGDISDETRKKIGQLLGQTASRRGSWSAHTAYQLCHMGMNTLSIHWLRNE